ncbi:NmrA-like family domain-containing oxidoreductase notO [Paramyrothecium foliicola]|nr:NmrA-like family domain-containing oxidoreductase notO [Paramyrothecium foliicola]
MVSQLEIEQSNSLINDTNSPCVAVFVGGTSGIGKLIIQALVSRGTSLKVYLIGRKSSRERTQVFIEELNAINPKAQIIWTEGEVSLLAETKRICSIINARESSVDLLFLSTGYTPFGPRNETSEGLDISLSLTYYSRMLLLFHLLPLLKFSKTPRVINVRGGGMERTSVNLDDLDLRQPGNFGAISAVTHNIAMTTTILDRLARENSEVVFIHSCPGWVDTGNVRRGEPGWLLTWFIWLVLDPLIKLFSISDEVSAQRHLFQCTSGAFGGQGTPWTGGPGINTMGTTENGLFLVNYRCNSSPNAKVVGNLRKTAQQRVWDHTLQMLQPYL